jgi:IMP dehydrogenase/GMP reductase
MKYALTYDDIALIPEFSEIESRQTVNLETSLTTHYKLMIPIVASPMDTVCESEMAIALAEMGGVGCIHRFMTIQHQAEEVQNIRLALYDETFGEAYKLWNGLTPPIMAAVGANGDYLERAIELTNVGANVILIDVAHGHHILVKHAIHQLKTCLPSHVDIIAGNIVTAQAVTDLEQWGADGIRVGVGGGCFTPEMRVGTRDGMTPIVDVKIGDVVYTHTGEPKEVIHKFEYDRDEEIMVINGIECTKNHEFYVVHKRHADKVTDENIHEYAQWIAAVELTDEYFLIEL